MEKPLTAFGGDAVSILARRASEGPSLAYASSQYLEPRARHSLETTETILDSLAKAGKPILAKRRDTPLGSRVSRLGHEPIVEREIVQRQQSRPQHLVGQEQMVQIRPAELPARHAPTIGLQRGRISLVTGIAQLELAVHGERRRV